MNENEKRAFRQAFEFYERWRGTVIETEEQWLAFAEDYRKTGIGMDFEHNPLGRNLLMAAVDTIDELYRGGRKPMPANYFGRDDM